MIKDIIKTLKVNHYVKNLIVVVPLLFSNNITNIPKIINCVWIFIAFCFISSAVYVLNDLIDIEQDRKHPIKCNRPIASGRLSKTFAIILCVLLIVLSSTIALWLAPMCFVAVILYLILNIFYSIYLKKLALIDAACIAFGFVLRILSGCFAISVVPSALVILMTFFASMFFTFSKRKLELQITDSDNRREALQTFDTSVVNQFVVINAILAISFYMTYTLDNETMLRAGTGFLYLTSIPFTLIVFRLLLLVNTANVGDDPIVFIENDVQIKFLIILYFVVLFAVLV
jgi:4-hydroxybenzoate polyprenyltransferase